MMHTFFSALYSNIKMLYAKKKNALNCENSYKAWIKMYKEVGKRE